MAATTAESLAFARGDRRKLVAARGRRLGEMPGRLAAHPPVLVLFGIAVVFPLIDTIRLSFFDIKGLAPPKYVGLRQLREAVRRPGLPQDPARRR